MILPDHILEKMDPKERAKLGKAGVTTAEAEAKFIARSEKDLQKQISSWLTRSSIPFINPPMHKKSALPVGWPDFTFALKGIACAVEVKHERNKPSKEQIAKREELITDGWRVATVYSYEDFIKFVKEAGA